MSHWLWTLSGWAYSVLVLACLVTALIRKREAAQALAWSLAIVFLPVAGPILFLTLGCTRVSRRLAKKIQHHASFGGTVEAGGPAPYDDAGPDDGRYPDDRWGALGRAMQGLGQGPRRTGNRTTLYTDGLEAYKAMARAIRAAKHHVHVEFYIFRNDEVGQRFTTLLCEKVDQGVEVRVILDGAGSFFGASLIRRLVHAGGEVAWFLPLFRFFKLVSPHLRNHRKIVICDGRVGFFGGLNIGQEYLGRRLLRRRQKEGVRDWADLHMRLEGSAVWDLQGMFIEDWDYSTGTTLAGPPYFPAVDDPDGEPPAGEPPAGEPPAGEPPAGTDAAGQAVQIIVGGPDLRPNPVRLAFFGAFVRAKRRILVVTPYLVPDYALRDALQMAARSGVVVQILTQYPPPDRWMPYFCALSFCAELDEAGVEVRGYTAGTVHAKAVVIDGEWAMLGTANLDNRSMFLNFEQMALFDSGADPARIEAAIDQLMTRSVRLDPAWLSQRPLYQRALMPVARLFAPLF